MNNLPYTLIWNVTQFSYFVTKRNSFEGTVINYRYMKRFQNPTSLAFVNNFWKSSNTTAGIQQKKGATVRIRLCCQIYW
jgi:hypothetical protein